MSKVADQFHFHLDEQADLVDFFQDGEEPIFEEDEERLTAVETLLQRLNQLSVGELMVYLEEVHQVLVFSTDNQMLVDLVVDLELPDLEDRFRGVRVHRTSEEDLALLDPPEDYVLQSENDEAPEEKGFVRWTELVIGENGQRMKIVRYYPVWMMQDNLSCYFTTTGENPVIRPVEEQASVDRSAGGWSDVSPDFIPEYYSSSKWTKKQARDFCTIIGFLWKHQKNQKILLAARRRYWDRYFRTKNETGKYWLTYREHKQVLGTFKKFLQVK